MPEEKSSVQISIPSLLANIELVDIVAEAAIRHFGIDEKTASNASLAVREAVANGVLHGNRQQEGKRVEVSLELDSEQLAVEVSDEGRGFDPAAVPDPLAPENLMKPNGRGIFLMRNLMDEVKFHFCRRRGTVVRMTKSVVARAAAERQGD